MPPNIVSAPPIAIKRVIATQSGEDVVAEVAIRVSLNSEPVTFSKLSSWCHPPVIVFCHVVRARLTVTPAPSAPEAAWAKDTVSLPKPPSSDVADGIALQRVVEVGTHQVLDIEQPVTLRIAPAAGPRHQAHRDPRGRSRIARRVPARSAIQRVGTGTTGDYVITARAIYGVSLRGRERLIENGTCTVDKIVPRRAVDCDPLLVGEIYGDVFDVVFNPSEAVT